MVKANAKKGGAIQEVKNQHHRLIHNVRASRSVVTKERPPTMNTV